MFRHFLRGLLAAAFLIFSGVGLLAAPYAAMVIDARTGKVLHARNADTRLHPASLTKMMTLYVAFEAIRLGEISLDTQVTVSKRAAAEPPSKLGLRAGQKIQLRYLIRAAAVKSANDAATAIAEAVGGSEAKFARRMNKTAKALGMSRTTFKNAHGLTENGHMSTARDMTTLGRHLFYDYPQYYNLFSRKTANVVGKSVKNTNRKFLAAYKGADGIKTGYTSAAGFNLVASAERNGKRIITTVFGGRSTLTRNQKVAELMDLGFGEAPRNVVERRPEMPNYGPKRIRVASAVVTSPRPKARLVRSEEEIEEIRKSLEIVVAEAAEGAVEDLTAEVENTARPAPREDGLKVVTRVSTSGVRHWSIYLGSFSTRAEAEKLLLRTALQDLNALDGALRKVYPQKGKYVANFVGLSEPMAKRACSRLSSRNQSCVVIDPAG